ncbi:MAG: hypothetical protein KTR18_15250 [Acidiferrobacterales bacterium]|nr:hypothetical protein [Acidiferrobacterales bacterium]
MKKDNTAHINLTKYIKGKRKVKIPKGQTHHSGHGAAKSVRVDEYKGKEIKVETTYKFYVDGKPLKIHAAVMNDGKVHCHNLPQYAFTSAIRMLKSVVDVMDVKKPPNELGKTKKRKSRKHHNHGE